jgi:hypothetical protein
VLAGFMVNEVDVMVTLRVFQSQTTDSGGSDF